MIVPATVSVLLEIRNERQRQVESEGWSFAHDDAHVSGELAKAAACYAGYAALPAYIRDRHPEGNPPEAWRWASGYWKPKDRRRDLVRAAALLVAEIERLDRAAEREASAK